MSKEYVIIADSTNDLPKEIIEENNIELAHLLYEVGGETYGKDSELSPHEFYERMRNGEPTKTAAANIEEIQILFEKHAAAGEDVLFMCLSSGISSTTSNGFAAKAEVEGKYPDAKIRVIDTLCASGGQGLLLYKAIENKKKGMDIDENYNHLDSIKMNVVHKFTVEDLKYLQRGGRISKAAATIGTMINLKPLLHVDNEGKLVAEVKVRGRKKSLKQIVENMGDAMGSYKDKQELIIVCHADVDDDVNYVCDYIKELYKPEKLIISGVTPTIGAHSGPGTIAIFFLGDIR